jgi:uncharacterized protein
VTQAQAFFLQSSNLLDPPDSPQAPSQRFCIFHPAQGQRVRSAVLYVHPWAEEMNKARRMVALQARALAEAGHAVLLLDLHGCGDSSGDFGDATWAQWIADVGLAANWLRQQVPGAPAPLCLWGLRAGCLLATQAAAQFNLSCDFLFWQPATQGKVLLQQFMRLKAAADMQHKDAKQTMAALRTELDAGQSIDVAGYRVSAPLALGLESASLTPPATPSRLLWLETSSRPEPELLPASTAALQTWRDAGHAVTTQVVGGPAFWRTQEIEDAPALLDATVHALATWSDA